MEIRPETGFAGAPTASGIRNYLPAEARRGLQIGNPAPRVWHRLCSNLTFRLDKLGRGAAITGVRLSPLPPVALVDWNKALPATVNFEGAALVISGGTHRSILDTLESVRIALSGSETDGRDLVLEFLTRIDGAGGAVVTTVGLSAAGR